LVPKFFFACFDFSCSCRLAASYNPHELSIFLTPLCKHVGEFKVEAEQPPPENMKSRSGRGK